MVDISIDLETLDSCPTAALATIGAVASDGSEFYAVVNDPEGDWRPQTIRWHAQQEDPAGNLGSPDDAVGIREALETFRSWLRGLRAHEEGAARLWTHATFDMPVLDSAYRRADIWRPWHYRNCRDLRTLYDLAGGRPQVEHEGKHHALYDARAQLREVQVCLSTLDSE